MDKLKSLVYVIFKTFNLKQIQRKETMLTPTEAERALNESEEKEKRAAELIIANKELAFQNEEKEKRADELIIANKELVFQNEEKEKRAAELIIAKESKRVEEATARLAAIIESSEDAIIGKDLNGIITSWNAGAEKLFGYSAQESVGCSINQIVPQDRLIEEKQILDRISRNELVQHFETVRLAKSGRLVDVSVTVSPIKDHAGKVVGASKVARDITVRKRAEVTFLESEAKFRTLVENIPQKILMKDRNYRWVSINESLARDFGFRPEEVVGKLDADLFTPELAAKYHSDDVRIMETGKTEEIEEKYMVAGKETWVNTIKTPVRGANGEIKGVLGVFWDITGRKLAEQEREELIQQLEDRSAQLETLNKELEAFSYSVSHDLRAPLRHINGYVDLLIERFHNSLPEKGKHYLDSIADSVHQMGALIDDLLQFSRTGRQEMLQADLDMNIIIQEVVETIKHDTSGRSIEWVIATLPQVYGDHALMRLVWYNLLDNAVKFTRAKEKATIEIGFREDDRECIFFVRDNGAGFDMQYAQKLFGVFQRLHSSEEFEGTGIGLANVNRIVLKHGGRTWAEAELDKGATFYFTLPNHAN